MDFLAVINQNKDKFKEGVAEAVQAALEVAKGLGYSVIANSDKEPDFIPKTRFDELVATKNALKEQVKTLTADLDKLKKAAGDNEELQKQIETMQGELEKAKAKSKEIAAQAAAKVAAIKAKAKDPDDVLKFIDFNKVIVNDDETVVGLDDQIKTLVESKAYLFEEKKPAGGGAGGVTPPGGGGNNPPEVNPWKSETFNLTKQGQILKTDPAMAKKLMQEAGKLI